MEQYIGTKFVAAEPCEKDGEKGYKVVYKDGYESWSPKDVFEEAYHKTGAGMTFGEALEHIKKHGCGMRLPVWKNDVVIRVQFPDENSKMTHPYLYVESRFGRVPWKETVVEMFDERWEIVE